MTKIKPNMLFDHWSPDEVAECLVGFSYGDDLYAALWKLVSEDKYDHSFNELPDNLGRNALSKWWDKLSDDHKTKLNEAAGKHMKEMGY